MNTNWFSLTEAWFKDYKDMIRFSTISNHDFRIIQKKDLGNILVRIKKGRIKTRVAFSPKLTATQPV